MRRTALVLALLAMGAVAGCGGNATPSSDVSSTVLPSASAQAASASAPATSPSPSVATSAPTPSPTPKPTPLPTAVCSATMLTAKVTGWQGAMGNQIATVTLTNAATASCRLRGTPELQLVDAGGHIIIDSKSQGAPGLPHVSPGDKTWTLAHNGWVTTMVQVSNYCGAVTPVMPTTVAFILPSNGGRLVAAAGPGGSAPPCYGNPGDPGTIAMNGWAH